MSPLRKLGRLCALSVPAVAAALLLTAAGPEPASAAKLGACSKEELTAAIGKARPGDEIVLCARTWTDTQIDFDVDGTASAPITLKAETPGKVVMTGSSTLQIGGSYAVVDGLVWTGKYTGTATRIVQFRSADGRVCKNCRLTNSSFIDYNPGTSLYGHWVLVYGQHNRLDHNYFAGKRYPGSIVQIYRGSNEANHAIIDHNFFSRPKLDQSNGGEALQIGDSGKYADSDSKTIVESNYFFEANGEIEMVSNKASGNTFRRNTFVASGGMLTIRFGNRVHVEGNYFFGDGATLTGGVRMYGKSHTIIGNYFEGLNPSGSEHRGAIVLGAGESTMPKNQGYYSYPPVKDVLIAHNTIVDSINSIYFSGGDASRNVAPENVTISNNIVSSPSNPLIVESVTPKNVIYERNIFNGPKPSVDEAANLFGAPDLVRNGDGVLRISESSIAVNAGKPMGTDTQDIDGTPRDGAPDIGADEFRKPDDYRAPVRLCDVGPTTYQPGLKSGCAVRKRPKAPQQMSASS